MPVYFNDPTNIMQQVCRSLEYNSLLDQASEEQDPVRRMGLVAVSAITRMAPIFTTKSKPFNPLLGETYEFESNDFEFLSEQVSHHPPVSAYYCRSKRGNYCTFSNQLPQTRFNGKYIVVTQRFLWYIDLPKWGERYELAGPESSAHNLLVGDMYVDVGG